MADAVALTSVITSGAVALAGILVGAQAARNQRRHEKELAFKERVWETKSDAMFRLITAVQDFRRPRSAGGRSALHSRRPKCRTRLTICTQSHPPSGVLHRELSRHVHCVQTSG